MVTYAAETVNQINVIRCTNVTDNDATVTFDLAGRQNYCTNIAN